MLWGFWDDRHWRGVEASLVEGDEFRLNAAGKKFRELVFEKWWTNQKIDLQDRASIRAFKV